MTTEAPPSPLHYFNKATGAWKLRKGNNPHDPIAFAETVERMRVEASMRPPRTGGRVPMVHSEVLRGMVESITGVLMPADAGLYDPEHPPEPPRDYAESVGRLGLIGLEGVMDLVEEGHSNREICERLGTRASHLSRWLASIPEGDTRMREARTRGAQAWLDRGLAVIEESGNLVDLAKAREVAALCRKYAAIYNPTFSDRVQVDTTIKAEDPESIDQKLRLLVAGVAQKALKATE